MRARRGRCSTTDESAFVEPPTTSSERLHRCAPTATGRNRSCTGSSRDPTSSRDERRVMDLELVGKVAVVTGASKGISQELGPKGICINSVSPGQVETDLW